MTFFVVLLWSTDLFVKPGCFVSYERRFEQKLLVSENSRMCPERAPLVRVSDLHQIGARAALSGKEQSPWNNDTSPEGVYATFSMRAVSPLAFQTGGYKALLIWGLGTGVFPVFRPCERRAL
jgi:hypothetical protein